MSDTQVMWGNILYQYQWLWAEGLLAVSGLALLLAGAWRGDGMTRTIAAKVMLVFTLAMLLPLIPVLPTETQVRLFHGMFVANVFTQGVKFVLLGAAAVVLLMTFPFLAKGSPYRRFEYPLLMLFSLVGMMVMVSSGHMLTLYLGLELQSLSLYVLAAIHRDSDRATEAGLKYFVLGAIASGMLLFGMSLIYGFTGVLDFQGLADVLAGGGQTSPALVAGLVFVLAGLCFKLSAAPFHMWTPDVYEGVPSPVTAYFATVPKLAAVALLVRLLTGPFGGMAELWQQVLIVASVASMAVGAFAALRQTHLKRLLAYSSIGHVGYALMGLVAASPAGISAVSVYMAVYVVMSLGAFGCVLLMRRRGKPAEMIRDLAGLHKTHPGRALAMAIFMFSMAGIPPLAGFFGKLVVFYSVVEAGLVWLAVTGVLLSVVSAFYYLRIVKVMYIDAPEGVLDTDAPAGIRAVVAVTAVLVAVFLLRWGDLLTAAEVATRSLL